MLNRCDSGTDSIVWMEEDLVVCCDYYALSVSLGVFLLGSIA